MPETLKLDYQKTENYNALFQKLNNYLIFRTANISTVTRLAALLLICCLRASAAISASNR